MSAAILIASKDLKQRIRDRSVFLLGIVAPLGLAFIFSLIIPDFSGASFEIDTAVVDLDRSEVSALFTDEVLVPLTDSGLIVLEVLDDADELRQRVGSGEIRAAWVIPRGFGQAVLEGTEAQIEVVGSVDAPISTEIAGAIARSFAADLSEAQLAAAVAAGLGLGDPVAFAAASRAGAEAVVLEDVSAATKELSGTTFFSAGMAVFFLFFTVQFGVSSLIEERTIGTMPRLLAAPISRMSIVAGKAIASFVVGLGAMIVLATATSVLVGARWGDPVGVGILMVCGVLAALGIMGLIATFATGPEQAASMQSIVAVVLGLLGGSFFPISQGPGFLANLSLLTPHAWFLRGLGDLAAGGGPLDIGGPVAALLLFSVLTMGVAAARVGRMVSA